jgi:hypothetical protein
MICTAGIDQGSATPIEISPDHHGYGYTVWKPEGTIGTNGPAWPSSIHGYKSWGDPSAVAMSIPTRKNGEEPYGRFDIGCSVHRTEDFESKATTHCLGIFSNADLHCNNVFRTELSQRNKDMRVLVGYGSSCGARSWLGMSFQRDYTCNLVETVKDLTDCTVCQDGFEAKPQFNGKGGCIRAGTSFEGDMAPVRIYPGVWQHHRLAQFRPHLLLARLLSFVLLPSFFSRVQGRCQIGTSLLIVVPAVPAKCWRKCNLFVLLLGFWSGNQL